MILELAEGDTINPIHPVIPRVENRRGGSRRQRRFPDIDEEGEEDSEGRSPKPENGDPETSPDPPDGEERKIDVHVSGQFIPTRQILPGEEAVLTLH